MVEYLMTRVLEIRTRGEMHETFRCAFYYVTNDDSSMAKIDARKAGFKMNMRLSKQSDMLNRKRN